MRKRSRGHIARGHGLGKTVTGWRHECGAGCDGRCGHEDSLNSRSPVFQTGRFSVVQFAWFEKPGYENETAKMRMLFRSQANEYGAADTAIAYSSRGRESV